MTCIAGMIHKRKGYIASDSLGSDGYTKNMYSNRKIFKKDDMLFGYTSSYRMGQIIEYHLSLPSRKVGQELEDWIYKDFTESIRKTLDEYGFLQNKSNGEKIGTFLMIKEGRLFKMQDDLSILESKEGYDSCGSGVHYATATIRNLRKHTKLEPKKILTEAIEKIRKFHKNPHYVVYYEHEITNKKGITPFTYISQDETHLSEKGLYSNTYNFIKDNEKYLVS